MSPEAELLARCRRGEAEAWNELFDLHYAAAGRFIFQLASDFTREDAEEICQEVFLSVIRNIDSFHGDSQFQTWLFRIAANKARDYRERRNAAKRGGGQNPLSLQAEDPESGLTLDPPASLPGPDEAMMNAEQMALMRLALDQLGEPCREIIELRYFGDLSYEELSRTLALNPKTVSSRLSKCLDRLEAIARKTFSREKSGRFPVQPLAETMEPERHIEKLLRNFAKKRGEQAGAPLELDPVARRQLQEEVARRARKPPEENFFLTLLALVRSRLAFTLCLVAVFVAGGWLLLPSLSRSKSKGSSRMAMGKSSSAMEERDNQLPATPPVGMQELKKNAPPNERTDSDLNRTRQEPAKLEVASADVKQAREPATPVPPTVATTATSGDKEKRMISEAEAFADARTSGVAIANSAAVPDQPLAGAPASPTAARRQARTGSESNLFGGGSGGGGGAGGNLVRFHRIPDPVPSASVGAPVQTGFFDSGTVSQTASSTASNLTLLSSFAIEQNGGALRIVDRDGSVYTGNVQLAELPPPIRAPVPERSKADAALAISREGNDRAGQFGPETGQRWSFRVSGTNISLKQNIVFSGDLFVRTNETVLNQPVLETTTGGTVDSVAIVPQLGLGNSRLRGTALIDNIRTVEIRAEPAR